MIPARPFLPLLLSALILGDPLPAAASILPDVPDISAVTDYRPKIPLRVYSADKVLIGEFGAERRDFVHGGIDWIRALGAARANITDFGSQGASTITMQVARNFFLSRDKTLPRKLTEIALAYKIEKALTKDQILEVYLNQIYLGQRSYGFSSAARTYFGKSLNDLTLAETAMLAGLPQNPSSSNPITNPAAAKKRQQTVLRRMFELKAITEPQYRRALAEPLTLRRDGAGYGGRAAWVAEIARQAVHTRFGAAAYERGITVTTTVIAAEQEAAWDAVRRNVVVYDRRHGYRGPEARIVLPAAGDARDDAVAAALQKRPAVDGFVPAVVVSASAKRVRAATTGGETIEITGAGLKFAAGALASSAKAGVKLSPGAVIRLSKSQGDWAITQLPEVAAAFVAVDAGTGAYRALVGGFDFGLNKFNHVTQAWRQPGSSIKPFVYSAGLERGFFPGTPILDAPLDLGGDNGAAGWSPRNDDKTFEGLVTVRHALTRSRNVPTVRMLQAIGVDDTRAHLAQFGFDAARHPRNLTMALGTGAVTPLQMAGAYTVLANGGYRVEPWLIARIQDGDGKVVYEHARKEPVRVLDARNAFITDSMLRDVARVGTAAAASRQLGRSDLAGKTGTTSNAIDGWFAGYSGPVVAVAWMGYDEPRSLGGREFGATLALPIWVDYMRVALANAPERAPLVPDGVVNVAGDWVYAEYADQQQQLETPPPPVDSIDTLMENLLQERPPRQ